MKTEIVTLPERKHAMDVYQAEKGLDPYLEQIRGEIDKFTPSVETKKGRDEIASIAHKVARSKTALDNLGKELVAELKEIPKKIDAERKRVRDTLDQWKDEVRRPLTEWEEGEKARVAAHQSFVDMLKTVETGYDESSQLITERLENIRAMAIDESLEEFEAEAHRAKAQAVDLLESQLEIAKKREAEQAELERLRQEQREREEADRIERAKQEAIEAERARQKEEAEQKEREHRIAIERANREKAEAEAAALREKEEAEKRQKQAVEDERKRIEAEQAAEQAEAEKRERNRKHKAKIHNEILADIDKHGIMKDSVAKALITLIAKGEIRNVKIVY